MATRPLGHRIYHPVLFVNAIIVKAREGQVRNLPFYFVMGVWSGWNPDQREVPRFFAAPMRVQAPGVMALRGQRNGRRTRR